MEHVKCRDCGFLSVRNRQDSTVYAADERVRKTAKARAYFKVERGFTVPAHSDSILCFKGRSEFAADVAASGKLETIGADRHCPDFVPWVPGYTPQRHDEMSFLEEVQALYERRHQELRADVERQFRANFRLNLAMMIATLIAAILSGALSGWFSAILSK